MALLDNRLWWLAQPLFFAYFSKIRYHSYTEVPRGVDELRAP